MRRVAVFAMLAALTVSSFWTPAVAGMMCSYAEKFQGHCDVCNWGCALEWLFALDWYL